MQPFAVDVDMADGVMDECDRVITRRASDMLGYYADDRALRRLVREEADPVHYEVFEKTVPAEYGHLAVCISKLYPGVVGEECFMTKGHYHADPGTAEVYLGIRGRGYILIKNPAAACILQPIERGRFIYVPPHWAHRSVNTGTEPLVSLCVYPAQAGHNYGDIERDGFPRRVYVRNDKEVVE
jgi:glucose-6-phosphate isomerase